jgi:hypothetical protein
MTEAGIVERGNGTRGAFRSDRRFAGGGYPAFTTVHLHNSGKMQINP